MGRILLTFSFFAFLSACNIDTNCMSKEAMITNFDKFIKDVEQHHEKLEQSDWAHIDEELKAYIETCYPKFKEDMNVSEKVTFWKQTLSYGVYRGSASGSYQLDIDIDYETELNELTAQGRQEIEAFIREELKPDLDKTIDGVVKEVEKLGDELKNWLDNL